MKTGRILTKNGVMVNQALLVLSAMVYIIYTIPTLYVGIRDGFFCDSGHIAITIWGGLVTIVTLYLNYRMISDLRRTKKYNSHNSVNN
jgi:hypothetical protein